MSSYLLNKAMYEATRAENTAAFQHDKAAWLGRYPLSENERNALLGPSFRSLLAQGGLPNLVYRYFRLHGFRAPAWRARLEAEARGRAP